MTLKSENSTPEGGEAGSVPLAQDKDGRHVTLRNVGQIQAKEKERERRGEGELETDGGSGQKPKPVK